MSPVSWVRGHPWAVGIVAVLLVLATFHTVTGGNDPTLHDLGLPTTQPCLDGKREYGWGTDTKCGDEAEAWCRNAFLAPLKEHDCVQKFGVDPIPES
jgi:hypothetical protein